MGETFNEQIARYVRDSLLSWLSEVEGTTSEHSFRVGMVLTPEAEDERADFSAEYEDRGCTCFISPPCGYCTHPGNPANQEEDESCWIPVLKGGAA